MSIKQAIEALEVAQDALDISQSLQESAKSNHHPKTLAAYERVSAALAALRSMPAEPVAWTLEQILDERDEAQDMADQLADQIAAITGTEIGEHTSANDPWRNAMFAADQWIAEDLRRMFDGRQEQPRPPVAHRLRNAPSEIDYDLLIAACYERTGQAQGTKGCVQFAKGAEWYRELIAATPHTEAVRMSESEILDKATLLSPGCKADLILFARAVEQATAARLGVKMGDV